MSANELNNDFQFDEILAIIKDGFTTTITNNYAHYREYAIDISLEQQFIRTSNKDPKKIYIVVKFGSATVNYGQTVLPVSMTVISEQNKLDVCHDLLLDFVKENNLVSYEDGKIQQIYNTPVVFSNFHEMYEGYRSLASVKGVFLISYAANYYYIKTFDPNSIDIASTTRDTGTQVTLVFNDGSQHSDDWYVKRDNRQDIDKYSENTIYSQGDFAFYGEGIYKSLLANNINHNPETSSEWWLEIKPIILQELTEKGTYEFKKVPYAKWYLLREANDSHPEVVDLTTMENLYGVTVTTSDNLSSGSLSFDATNSLSYDSTSYEDASGQTDEMTISSTFFQNTYMQGNYSLVGTDISSDFSVKKGDNATAMDKTSADTQTIFGSISFNEDKLFVNSSFDLGIEAGEWSVKSKSANVTAASVTNNSKATAKLSPTIVKEEYTINRKNYYEVYIDDSLISKQTPGDVILEKFNNLKLSKTTQTSDGSYSFELYLDKYTSPGEGIDLISDFNSITFDTFVSDAIEGNELDSSILTSPGQFYCERDIEDNNWRVYAHPVTLENSILLATFTSDSDFSNATGITYTAFPNEDYQEIYIYYKSKINTTGATASNVTVATNPSDLDSVWVSEELQLDHTYVIEIPTIQEWSYLKESSTTPIAMNDVTSLSELENVYGITATVSDSSDLNIVVFPNASATFVPVTYVNVGGVSIVQDSDFVGVEFAIYHFTKTWSSYWTLKHIGDNAETIFYEGNDLLTRYGISFDYTSSFVYRPISVTFDIVNTVTISNQSITGAITAYNIDTSKFDDVSRTRTYIFKRETLYNYYINDELQNNGFSADYGIVLDCSDVTKTQRVVIKLDYENLEEIPCMNASFDFSNQLDSQPYVRANNFTESEVRFGTISITFSTFLLTDIGLTNRVLDVICANLEEEPNGVNTTFFLSVVFKNGKKIAGKFKLVHCAGTESIINSDLPVVALTFTK